MVTAKSVIEMSGSPPFLPYNPVGLGEGREHIDVRQAGGAIGISVTESSALTPQVSSSQPRHAPLSLELIDRDGIHTFLRDIPFEIRVSDDRVFTLSSENQQTHWRFLIRISASSKEMKMQFTMSYAGQTIDGALAAINF